MEIKVIKSFTKLIAYHWYYIINLSGASQVGSEQKIE